MHLTHIKEEDHAVFDRVEKLKKEVLEDHAANKREQAKELKETARYVDNHNETEKYLELAKLAEMQAEEAELEIRTRQEHLDTIASLKARRF